MFAEGCTLNKPTVLKNGDWLLPVSRLAEENGAGVCLDRSKARSWKERGSLQFPDWEFDEHMMVELRDGRLWMLARTKGNPVQRSVVLQRLNEIVPPRTILNALGRIDPFQSLTGPPVTTRPLDPSVLRQPGVRRAAPSVVRVLGTACGLGVEGSGWGVAPRLVVTAAHVVAGEHDTTVTPFSGRTLQAQAVAFDSRNDLAILRVPGLTARPLRLVDPAQNASVAIVGYPEDGPLNSVPGRIGTTVTVLSDDAYGRGPVTRTVTSLSGFVRHGNSGGPAVDTAGAVQATVFAARATGSGGYGIPATVVRQALASARGPVSTGPCAR